ncbi:hypothetical protein [Bacillus cereus]|uniref:Uncharacterized protein n=1 Tax=Bacillus cereus TaxID=1396 RepID=A0A0G8ED79_BACCE|nr:hypothetical protein [Bacillus cereus]KLA22208.1 hypothetical protein B4077_3154 [Bacillus cereus]
MDLMDLRQEKTEEQAKAAVKLVEKKEITTNIDKPKILQSEIEQELAEG